MNVDWALLEQSFYLDAVIYAVVSSGLYARLVRGADAEEIRRYEEPMGTLSLPAGTVMAVLEYQGLIRIEQGQWYWSGPAPSVGTICRLDAMRNWLNIAAPVEGELASWRQNMDKERLVRSGTNLNALILAAVKPEPDSHWLDVGGGSGALASLLAQHGVKATMIDTPAMVSRLDVCSLPHLKIVAGNALSALPPGKFDVVSLVRFIEDFSGEEIRWLFTLALRSLAPHGRIVVVSSLDAYNLWAKLFAVNIALHKASGRIYNPRLLRILAAQSRLRLSRYLQYDGYAFMEFRPLGVPTVRTPARLLRPKIRTTTQPQWL